MAEFLPAAAVVPRLRDGRVLVGERTSAARSYPGYLAFPGGGMDAEDRDIPLLVGGGEPGERGCAMRELGEESGRWLVTDRGGGRPSAERADAFSRAIREGAPLLDVMRSLELVFDDRSLITLGRWHTADARPKRFAVRQFLLEIDDEARFVLTDPVEELHRIDWIHPVDLRRRWRDGTALLLPPIRHVVIALYEGRHESQGDLVERLRAVRGASTPESWELVEGIELQAFRTPTLPPATHTNTVLLGTGDFIVVDPATPYDDERARFDALIEHYGKMGRRPAAIFLTHHHGDHVSDAERVRAKFGAPILSHPETARRVPFEVDRLVEDGEVLVCGGPTERAFTAVFTPGHAPGHLCLLERDTGVLVAGDMVAGVGSILIDPPEGHMGTYLQSLTRLLELSPRHVIPSHGPLIADGKARIESHLFHRRMRQTQVLTALATRGRSSPEDLVPDVYGSETPVGMYPLAARSVLAALELLVEEGQARAADGLYVPA